MSQGSRRVGAAVLIAIVTLFTCEGLLVTFTGRSLLRRLPQLGGAPVSAGDFGWRSRTATERQLAAAASPGLLALHADPLVGYVLRSNADLRFHDSRIRSDHLGLRKRARPVPEGDPLRIAIVGASVPFGYGLSDDETIAHHLEELLDASRGPQARPILCRTVAMGRWSCRNAVSFLLGHLLELRPDVVVYLSFPNELSDTDIVDEGGYRAGFPDPAAADPWLSVRADHSHRLQNRLRAARGPQLGEALTRELGPDVLTADLSPESSRRYDESAAFLLRLEEALRARQGTLLLMPCIQHEHGYHLLARLRRVRPGLPAAPLLAYIPDALSLGWDPHPNAATARALAILVARELLERGLVDRGSGLPLPELPAACAPLLAPPLDGDVVERESDRLRGEARARLLGEVDFISGRGVAQVYGGVSASGLVGPRALLLLAPEGAALEISLAPITERPDLYPLDVAVELDGEALGSVRLTAAGRVTTRLSLPPRALPQAPLEVRLLAPRWVTVAVGDSREVAAFRPLRVACADE